MNRYRVYINEIIEYSAKKRQVVSFSSLAKVSKKYTKLHVTASRSVKIPPKGSGCGDGRGWLVDPNIARGLLTNPLND